MKFTKRPAGERGVAEHGWLHARFSFSFANYYDPKHCGFHSLVVMNNDVIEPGGGFGTHPHKNAEIFTFVLSGELEHRDSMGNGSVIHPGNLQYMSAGSGVTHSEFNPSSKEPTELYQIWMSPKENGGEPRYSEKKLGAGAVSDNLKLLFSGDGREDSTQIRQDAEFYFGQLNQYSQIPLDLNPSLPNCWIQIISGSLTVNSERLKKADGLAVENQGERLTLEASEPTEFFVFKLAA
jgi:redox-sensitive bicupin YhaK (pirin superfamily)